MPELQVTLDIAPIEIMIANFTDMMRLHNMIRLAIRKGASLTSTQ